MSRTIQMGARPKTLASNDFDALIAQEVAKGGAAGADLLQQLRSARAKLRARRKDLMPAQLKFLEDSNNLKAAVCTRRAGKTFAVRHAMLEAVLDNPWDNRVKAQPIVQYITLTQGKAKDLVWEPLKALCEAIGLEAYWDDHTCRALFPNGVLLRLGGADTTEAIEKYRGDAYPLVVIDESASFGPRMEELVMSALSMALADYNGSILMVGSPGEAQVGFFYDIFCGLKPNWTCHRWSWMTNVHLPVNTRTNEWIIRNVGPLDSPKVRRECFGEWVPDASSLVYRYDSGKCEWNGTLPHGHEWRYILGLDLGFRDPTAFVLGAYSRTHPAFFILECEQQSEMLPSEIAERIGSYKSRYPALRIICDTGGSMARSNVEEWNRHLNFGILPAEKKNKNQFISFMNSDMASGRVKVKRGLTIVQEWAALIWEPDDPDHKRHDGKVKEHPGFPNHLSDACLYAHRESMHFRSKEPEPEPVPGTDEYLRKQQIDAKLKAFRKARSPRFNYDSLKNRS